VSEKPQQPADPKLESPLYPAISQHWAHSEQIRWTLLYNFLMASTILLLAWATIFVAANPCASARRPVLIAFAIAGLVLSIAWVGIVLRSGRFVDMYASLGHKTEEGPPAVRGPFTAADLLRPEIKGFSGVARSSRVLLAVPSVFGLLYLYLIWVSACSR
jgi:hypothetical protein